jgi:Excreted virulence factor EspC, type VII ESX diderm
MADLVYSPGYLEKLAKKQDDGAGKTREAATATKGIETAVWVTHGVISGVSNGSFTAAEEARRSACNSVASAISDLAAALRTAEITYQGVDADLGENLNTQVHSK